MISPMTPQGRRKWKGLSYRDSVKKVGEATVTGELRKVSI
jgi:hypothetical protein